MIEPVCDCCGLPLIAYGALLFSPPAGYAVSKFHICAPCYESTVLPMLKHANTKASLTSGISSKVDEH